MYVYVCGGLRLIMGTKVCGDVGGKCRWGM